MVLQKINFLNLRLQIWEFLKHLLFFCKVTEVFWKEVLSWLTIHSYKQDIIFFTHKCLIWFSGCAILVSRSTHLRWVFQFFRCKFIWVSPAIPNLKADLSKPCTYCVWHCPFHTWSHHKAACIWTWIGVIKNISLHEEKHITYIFTTLNNSTHKSKSITEQAIWT